MSFNMPASAEEVVERAKSDVQSSVKTSNPFLANGWINATITSFSHRIFDFYLQLEIAKDETFFDTSTGDRLLRQASWFGVTPNDSVKSSGDAIFTGIEDSAIPINTALKSSTGVDFLTRNESMIVNNEIVIDSITRALSTATATTLEPHNLSNNSIITITGVDQVKYNVIDSEVKIISETVFTYIVEGVPVTPATGTIQFQTFSARVTIDAVEEGIRGNVEGGELLTLTQAVAGINNSVGAAFNGISGGTDLENLNVFRDRFLFRVSSPIAHFSKTEIESLVLSIPSPTRVFVFEITPEAGQVTIYFVQDGNENIIPTGQDLIKVKNEILKIKPATTDDADVIILAPTPDPIAFNFSLIAPDSPSMRLAVTNQIADFLKNTSVGVSIQKDLYRAAITNTIDIETGNRLTSFVLTSPIGDININLGELATLDQVTF